MLAIKYATKVWRPMLQSCASGFDVLTNNVSCKYFMTTKVLNQRQICWAEQLADFHFRLFYCPGKLNDQADALSCQDDDGIEGDTAAGEQPQAFFQPHHLRLATATPYTADILLDEIQNLQLSDPVIMDQRKDIDRDQQYLFVNGALLFICNAHS